MWTRHKRAGLRVTPGFLLLLAGLLYLDEGVGLVPPALLACALHELGHILAALSVGGHVRRLTLSSVGAELTFDYSAPLSYGREILVTLAGPAANLLTGLAAYCGGACLTAALSFGIGAFNLLPIRPLDGGTVWSDLLAGLIGPDWAERVLLAVSGALVGLLVGAGAVAAAHYANFTLLLTAAWLLFQVLRRYSAEK